MGESLLGSWQVVIVAQYDHVFSICYIVGTMVPSWGVKPHAQCRYIFYTGT